MVIIYHVMGVTLKHYQGNISQLFLYGTEIPGPHRPWAQSQLYGTEIPGPGPGPIPALGAGPVILSPSRGFLNVQTNVGH